MSRTRLDQLLVIRGLAESRTKAQALIAAGAVQVDGQVQTKAGTMVTETSELHVAQPLPYVSRGGYKLARALEVFQLDPSGLVVLDVGAATGGFTDVLLQHGAAHVYAVDVGYGVLDWRLRQDARVTVLERTNIRHLTALPPSVSPDRLLADCATIDVSFISLRLVLPAVQRLIVPTGWIVALIKPQFEAGRRDVGTGGVVRDPAVHRRVLVSVLEFAADLGLHPTGLTRSPITGPAGNVEFLALLRANASPFAIPAAVEAVVTG